MNHIGIDISKYKHDCFIATETDHFSFSFENNQEGFLKLLFELKKLSGEIKIGFEITGHYAENLKAFLISHNFPFMEIHAYLVKKFVESQTLRKTKTDKKDARMISNYLQSVDYKTYLQQSYHIGALKELTRLRAKLISERTKYFNLLTKTLDIIFPEYKGFWPNNHFSQTSLYILEKFTTPFKIAKMTDHHYETLRKLSMGKFSYPKFSKLKELAKSTVGIYQEFHIVSLSIYLHNIRLLNTQVGSIENQIKHLMASYPTKIETITGIGTISAAVILAEYGSISNFDNPSQMLSYAGLEPSVSQSGTQTFNGRLVKRGSRILRSTLVQASFYMLKVNPKFYAYYLKKKSEGKHHQVALIHLTRKLIRIIFHLETTQQDFNPKLIK